MNTDSMMQHIDQIILHSNAIKILQDPDLTLLQSKSMIKEMFRQYEADSKNYYDEPELDSCCKSMAKSDLEELIEDDNRERATDMNAVNRSPY